METKLPQFGQADWMCVFIEGVHPHRSYRQRVARVVLVDESEAASRQDPTEFVQDLISLGRGDVVEGSVAVYQIDAA